MRKSIPVLGGLNGCRLVPLGSQVGVGVEFILLLIGYQAEGKGGVWGHTFMEEGDCKELLLLLGEVDLVQPGSAG